MDIFSTKPDEHQWPPCQHVIFDCDSTLSKIEGIDVLAKQPSQRSEVAGLTNAAMAGECALEDVYEKRLDLLNPTRKDIAALTEKYKQEIVQDAAQVVSTLMEFGIQVYVVSGGLIEPVREFSLSLGIPGENVHGVPLKYDELSGDWWRHDPSKVKQFQQSYYRVDQSQLSSADGKIHVINALLLGKMGRSALIGDGVSDLIAAEAVDLFIGFGGVACREIVEKDAAVFVHSPSLLPVLPLVIGSAGFQIIDSDIVNRAQELFKQNKITFRNRRQAQSFQNCFN